MALRRGVHGRRTPKADEILAFARECAGRASLGSVATRHCSTPRA